MCILQRLRCILPNTDSDRRNTPWRAPSPNTPTFNVSCKNIAPDSLLNHYRNLIHLRNAHPVLLNGDWVPVESSSKYIYAFMRTTAEEQILVVINASRETVSGSDYALTLTNGSLLIGARPVFVHPSKRV